MRSFPRTDTPPTVQVAYHDAPGLDEDTLRKRAPAIFGAPDDRLSAQYSFVPTEVPLRALRKEGWIPREVYGGRARRGGPARRTHLIHLRRIDSVRTVGDVIPQLTLVNSHDGRSAFRIYTGLHRLVCSNGLIVPIGPELDGVRLLHRGLSMDDVMAAARQTNQRALEARAEIQRMEDFDTRPHELLAFVERALTAYRAIVLPGHRIAPSAALDARRAEDEGTDLWRVFNRVQENLIRGGIEARRDDAPLARSQTPALYNPSKLTRLNLCLWREAIALMQARPRTLLRRARPVA